MPGRHLESVLSRFATGTLQVFTQKDEEVFVFTSIDDVQSRLTAQQYVSNRKLATVVFLATKMNKPILVEGPPGGGKNEQAKVFPKTPDRPLIRPQCYEGVEEADGVYERGDTKELLCTTLVSG